MLLITLVEISNMIQAVADGKGLFLDFGAGYPVFMMLGYIETAPFIKEQATKIYSENPLKESVLQIFALTW